MTTCIQYSRPSSGQGESEVFGLDIAVNNLLSAYFRYGTQETFFCRPSDIPSFEHFKALALSAGRNPEKSCIGLDPRFPKHNLEAINCIFRPDPLTADLIWQRVQVREPGFSTCGLVHTMSGERIANAVGQIALAPSDATDALICPSHAIRDAVNTLWEIQTEYLNHRTGGTLRCTVKTPVIPLGVDSHKFFDLASKNRRLKQREILGVKDNEIIILFVGRLSFATKAHPLAMWNALQIAAKQTRKKLRLIMYGYYKPKDMEQHFKKLANEVKGEAEIEFIMNDDVRFPDGLWAGADIFVSPSDNIQESFGLTPIEALASGLPTVVTNWDGYRDNVRDGIDGFLIPTIGMPISSGRAIAEAYFNEQNYGVALVGAAQSTAVDVECFARALSTLANNENLREKMAENGRSQAQDVFDWKHIIKRYEELWSSLSEQRKSISQFVGVPKNWEAAHPSYPNPFAMFKSFPSRTIVLADRLKIVMDSAAIETMMKHEMNYFLPELLIPSNSMQELIEAIRKAGSPSVRDVLTPFPATEHPRILRCLGWMLKHSVCELV